jgi:hypothetical protein
MGTMNTTRRRYHILLLALLCGLWAQPVWAQTTWGPESINTAGADGDDGSEQSGAWAGGGTFVGIDGASYHMGLRWVGVDVPKDATIVSATLCMTARNLTGAITDVHGIVHGHEGDAPAFANGVFSPTEATGAAFNPVAFVADTTVYTVSVAAQVQEIVNGTWTTGDDLALAVFDNSSAATTFLRVWDHGDGGGSSPCVNPGSAALTIVYTEGAPAGPVSHRLLLLGVGSVIAAGHSRRRSRRR